MTHIFFSKRKKQRSVGFSFCFPFFKTCCVWMKLACNHTDHKERKYSVLPFNPVMAYKQNGILWSGAHKSSEKEIVLHTTSTTFHLLVARGSELLSPVTRFAAEQSTVSGVFWSRVVWITQTVSVCVSAGIPPEGFTAFLIGLYLNISPARFFLECESSGKSFFFF